MTAKTNTRYWLALAALFAAAIYVRHVVAPNTDVSWLLTVGERVLDGQTLYRDIIETNPPMAVLAYMPGIVIARALHVPAELIVDALVFFGIAVSLGMTAKILKHSSVLKDVRGWSIALIAFAVLAILPTQTFGQREHLALIALLPAMAVYAMRANDETPLLWAVIAAGLGAGLTLMFKPHFAIAILCGVSALALYIRNLKMIFAPENFIAAACVGIYALLVVLIYPDYVSVMIPLSRDVYVPVGLSLKVLLSKDAVSIWFALMFAALMLKRRSFDAPFVLLLATSIGFAIVFLVQRKGFAYHSYPMIALGVLALTYAIATRDAQTTLNRAISGAAIALLAALFVNAMIWFDNAFDAKPLEAPVARLGANPKILAITAEPGIGHPLVRALGGTWVSRQQGLWVAAYIQRMKQDAPLDPACEAALEKYAARERAMLIDDIKAHPPTVVLIDDLTGDWSAWLRDHPDVADLLKSYRQVDALNKVTILTRAN